MDLWLAARDARQEVSHKKSEIETSSSSAKQASRRVGVHGLRCGRSGWLRHRSLSFRNLSGPQGIVQLSWFEVPILHEIRCRSKTAAKVP